MGTSTPTTTTHQLRIAVIGAGPAGLCLARILQQNGLDVTVFEGDASATSRAQGGSLDLHGATGQRAIRAAGLYSEFLQHVQVGADAMRIMDHKMAIHYEDNGGGDRPEIERQDLRAMLLNSLKEGTVQWNKKLSSVQPVDATDPGTDITCSFTDGSTFTCRIVVGADGAWSKVRGVLTDVMPVYTGISIVDITHPKPAAPEEVKEGPLRRGMVIAVDDTTNTLMFAHLGAHPHAYVARRVATSEEPIELDVADLTKDWAPELRTLLSDPRAVATHRQIVALPTNMRWTRDQVWKGRVAIIGDAAHVMSPFAGEGANLALIDAADLALAIVAASKHGGGVVNAELAVAIERFEVHRMWGRARRAAKESAENLEQFFSGVGPAAVATWMRSHFSLGFMVNAAVGWLVDTVSDRLGLHS